MSIIHDEVRVPYISSGKRRPCRSKIFGTPGSCVPSIKLEGKNEYLFEPSDVEGLIFSVKGFSSVSINLRV